MAAGLGFKTFTTGEVLTAADVNGYLMQGVLVFATEAARNSAITSPQEGQFAFTKDTNSLWYYSGSAWVASGATGDIEGVTAGTGISGGGTSGTVTITNSMATAIDAKGDLVPGTGADTFSRLAVGANGTVLTADSAEATGLKWATPSSTPSFVGCSLYLTSTINISNNTNTAVSFVNESFDTDGFHSNATNTTRITIPSGKAGKYLFIGTTSFEGSGTGHRQGQLYKNGSLVKALAQFATITTGSPVASGSAILDCAVNDYFELYVYQNNGTGLLLDGSITQTSFYCQYLGA